LLKGAITIMRPSSFATTEVLMRTIEYVSPAAIKPNPRNARTHSKKQIEEIAKSVDAFDFTVPVIIDETSTLLAGHLASRPRNFVASRKYPPSGYVA
jgi:ParB-like nuclease domain